ncbi:MAG: tetratricopeptide repeat protein, partial [Bacteroidales bacterium]|nr:tetratricopeptide repeat protein [Bacteroidales bacterium]
EKITEIAPGFIYAWYNRGNMRFMQKDYRSALEDYNRAIELNEDFAEAWYNRGVTRIYLGERNEGLRDLSRAGELGIYKAYNLIKRFSE